MVKVALAYSGGLDTAICAYWLKNVKGFKVYTFSANIGQFTHLEPLAEQAIELGAIAAHIADIREKFICDFIHPCIRANAQYEQGYYLSSALSKPLIIQELVNIAKDEGCEFIAHGSRSIGNDSIRIENCIKVLALELGILTPLGDIGLTTPQEDISYAKSHNIKIRSERETIYNMEQNLWGSNFQIRNKDLWEKPPQDTYFLTTPVEESPNKVTNVEIEFEMGLPLGLNGERLPPVKLIDKLNKIGGQNAIGRYDVIENRLSGIKTREIYEAPAATILYTAHKILESITLEKELVHFKDNLSYQYGKLVYEGKWFTPLREGLDAFFKNIQEKVSGIIRLNLYKGNLTVTCLKSPNSLYK